MKYIVGGIYYLDYDKVANKLFITGTENPDEFFLLHYAGYDLCTDIFACEKPTLWDRIKSAFV